MKDSWNAQRKAFTCAYTGVVLTNDFGPRHGTWEHREPGNPSDVVLVSWLINNMKIDLTEAQFTKMVRALADHFESDKTSEFDESAFPDEWMRGRRATPTTPPEMPDMTGSS